jgi:threonine synthase
VALAAAIKLVRRGEIKRSDRVVVISTAHGLKFSDFKVNYHEGKLPDVVSTHANRPIELPPDLDTVRRTIDEHMEAHARDLAPR